MDNYLLWLFLTLICIFFQSFYSMLEMASVSFNKVRLQYFVGQGHKRALWLQELLKNPTRLFGTTLLCVNIALQVGSECSRRFYSAIHINPDIAPLTQVFLVLIFAEITPLFAARKYSQSVVMLGIPILYASSKIFFPIIWTMGQIAKGVNYLLYRKLPDHPIYLSRDEIKRAIEDVDSSQPVFTESIDFDKLVDNIFTFEKKTVSEVMIPLHAVKMVPSFYTVSQMKSIVQESYHPQTPVYQNFRNNIVGIATCRDFIKFNKEKRISEIAKSPWFVTQDSSISQILKQFQHNNQKLSVVLDSNGLAIGILSLEDILSVLFTETMSSLPPDDLHYKPIIEKTFPADMKLKDFNREFHAHLKKEGAMTLGQLITKTLGHIPEEGESIRLDNFEIKCTESTLVGPKRISVKTLLL